MTEGTGAGMTTGIVAMKEKQGGNQTISEEIANSVTHGIGLALSIAGLCVLVALAGLHGDAWRVVSFSIYGGTLVILYAASLIYHTFRSPHIKHILKIVDHSAIYLLIAGTYTPFTLVNLRGAWGWTLFGLVWGLAIAGIVFKMFFVHRFGIISTIVYILMGWLVIMAIKPLMTAVPLRGIVWLVAGGLCYTLGVIFYAGGRIPYFHTIWHVFVMAGSVLHYFAIFLYVLPMQ